MSIDDREIRDRIRQNDVTIGRSYLEVDFMEWFSDNEIPFGYEAFTIPSVVGPNKDEWDTMVDAIQAVGEMEFGRYDMLTEGTRWDDVRPAELQGMWQEIYDKHRLMDEVVSVEVSRSLSGFSKRMLLPDFAVYRDAGTKIAGEGFDWSSWDAIVEVSGLWGVGLPGESSESDWWDWYRVSAVAFKEFAYKLLGLWDDVYYVVPNQPYIEGISDGIPRPLRNDDHYIIFNTTQATPDLEELYDALGLSEETVKEFDNLISPKIGLVSYDRDLDSGIIRERRYDYDGLNMGSVINDEKAVIVDEGWIVYHGDMGEVYFNDDGAFVRESQWRNTNMKMLEEYATDIASKLDDNGIIENMSEIEDGR